MSALFLASIIGESIIAVASVIGNGLVLFLIVRHYQLQNTTNYFIASLAAADLLVGLLGIPSVIVTMYQLPADFRGCLVMNSMIVILTQISIFGLLVIAVERFVAVSSPFRYQRFCTNTMVVVAVTVTWVTATLVGLVPAFGWNLGNPNNGQCNFVEVIDMEYMVYFNFFGCVLLPLIVMFCIYIYIFCVVKRQMQQIAALQVGPSSGSGVDSQKGSIMKESKAAKSLAIVLLFFALCWLPIHIMNTISLLAARTCFSCLTAAILLSHANSALNPVLYAYGNSKFRKALKKTFGCGRAQISPSMSTIVAVPNNPVHIAPPGLR